MTVNLNTFMKFRDQQVAEDVGRLYELGWFDKEFAMYGCAYLEAGEVKYLISAHAEKVYDFIEAQRRRGCCPTPVLGVQETRPVPSGMQEAIAQSVKVKLGRALREKYPRELLQLLARYGQTAPQNGAEKLLREQQGRLEGRFEAQGLQVFEGLLVLAYESKVLSEGAYRDLSRWLSRTRQDMADDVVVKDTFERRFYGIVYAEGGGRRYLVNAQRERVYEQKYALELAGRIVSPVYARACWYNYRYKLSDARRDYEAELAEVYGPAYLAMLMAIRSCPPAIDKGAFCREAAAAEKRYGQAAGELLRYYGCLWNVPDCV